MPTPTAREAIFQVLADATEPLDRTQLAAMTGASRARVHDVLARPVNAGWVAITVTRSSNANTKSPKYLYTLTDTGRVQLARYIKPANKEG